MGLFSRFRRESTEQRAAWLEEAVSTAGQRAHQHMLADLRNAGRSFESAETHAWTDSWSTSSPEINEVLASQLPTLRARARNLGRNNEWAIRYLTQLDDNVLGASGIRLQMRLKNADGTPDKTNNDLIEQAWALQCQRGHCETSGRLSWRQVESVLLKALPNDGEILVRERLGGGPFGYQVQLLNAALLDVAHSGKYQGRRIRMGIELTDDDQPVAYWLRAQPSGSAPIGYLATNKHVRVPAGEIIHAFKVDEVGQLRGIPWLAPGARRLWQLGDFEQAAAVASANSAKREGFFVSPNGDAPIGFADQIVSSVMDAARAQGKTLTPEEIQQVTAAAQKFSTTMPGQFDTLPQGYDFKPFESDWPNLDSNGYVKQQLRAWTAARGISYVTGGNDLEAVNYSSARVGIIDEREHYKGVQSDIASWLHADVFRRWLRFAVLRTPGLDMSRLDDYLAAATWQPRRWKGIDPVKEASGNEIDLKLGLTSRRRLIMERGEDPDEIADEIERDAAQFGPLPDQWSGGAAPEPNDPQNP